MVENEKDDCDCPLCVIRRQLEASSLGAEHGAPGSRAESKSNWLESQDAATKIVFEDFKNEFRCMVRRLVTAQILDDEAKVRVLITWATLALRRLATANQDEETFNRCLGIVLKNCHPTMNFSFQRVE